ncbi:MAG TPA: carboxymuconolactone decarboxylase family protein [Solirubrobacteraceae bacterium]|jgi:4-carboxymuconolactone decarboxylase
MTRIEGVSPRRAGLIAKFAYRSTRRQFGRMMDPISVYAHAPTLLAGYGALEQATARQHRVSERLKVLGETRAAAVANCEFCVDIASHIAREAGVTEAQLLAMPRYRESEEFDELEKLVLDYATAISSTPARVSDELFAALRERFDERQLVELTNVIALENMRARFNSAFDMTPAGFSEGMVCVPMERPASAEVAPEALGAPTAVTSPAGVPTHA